MSKETANLLIQIASLIVVAIYAYLTWKLADATKGLVLTAQEMTQATQRISQSYIKCCSGIGRNNQRVKGRERYGNRSICVVHFDAPYGKSLIHLVIKNIGRTIAHNVKIKFVPPLKTGLENIQIGEH